MIMSMPVTPHRTILATVLLLLPVLGGCI